MRILVLDGNENQAVACVRSLARAGHRVEVGASTAWSKAGWSRWSTQSFRYPSPETDPDGFIEALARRVEREPGTLVLPLTERATLPVSQQREKLQCAGARLVLPSHQKLLRAFDKSQTTLLARAAGLETPLTQNIQNRDDAFQIARNFPLPAVLKARASQEMDENGAVRATGAPVYARTADEFTRAYDELRARCRDILAQQWVAGQGAGYFALCRNGEVRAEFAHRRLRDVRPTGSGSALRESVAMDDQMRDGARALLESLDWHGVAMVEFRVRADHAPVFLEVNGRFWNSLALAIHAGVDFPNLLAQMAEFGDVETPFPQYQNGVRCRWWLGDARHLIEIFRGAPVSFPGAFPSRGAALKEFLAPDWAAHSDNFQLNDPLPEVGDWLDFALRRLPAQLGKTETPKPQKNYKKGALHLHSTYSDGEFSLSELREKFLAAGCDFVCVTDHAEAFDAAKLCAYEQECAALSDENFVMIAGLEYGCGRLHILGYGLTSPVDSVEPNDVIAQIRARGGVCVVAHPQDRFFGRIESFSPLPHGIEVWNSKYDGRYAPRADTFRLLARLQKREASVCAFYGQDLHWKRQFRGLFCGVKTEILSRETVLEALKNGDFFGLHGELELPSNGYLDGETRAVFKRAGAVSRVVRRVGKSAAGIGKSVPAPLKAQLRRIF